jgi:hypothetical protein
MDIMKSSVVNGRFGGTCRLNSGSKSKSNKKEVRNRQEADHSSKLMMDDMSSETSVDFQRNTLRYIPQNMTS